MFSVEYISYLSRFYEHITSNRPSDHIAAKTANNSITSSLLGICPIALVKQLWLAWPEATL